MRTAPALLLATLVPLLLLASTSLPAQDAPPAEPRVQSGDLVSVFSDDIVVPAGTVRQGDVVCIGGKAVIAGEVTGDVVVVLGNLRLSGVADGDVVAVLSDVTLERGAAISQEFVNVLGKLKNRASHIAGRQYVDLGSEWLPSVRTLLLWSRLFFDLVAFVLLVLLLGLVPERIRVIGDAARARYVPAFFIGLLGYLGFLLLLVPAAVTLIGFPILWFGFWVAKWMGIAGIFYAVGRGLGRSGGRDLSLLGAVLLVFAVYVVVMLAPMALGILGIVVWLTLAGLFFLLVEVPAVGLVILTRAGGRTGRVPLAAPAAVPAVSLPGGVP